MKFITLFAFGAFLLMNNEPTYSKEESQSLGDLPDDPSANQEDRKFISRTYEIARSAYQHGNHPFGALLVRDGEIILEFENAVHTSGDITRHAETGLIGLATQKFDEETLRECTLYTSTEPCIMCCGSIYWAGVPKIVYGTSADRMVKIIFNKDYEGFPSREIYERIAPKVKIVGPVMEEEGLEVHKEGWPVFFRKLKEEKEQ